MCTVPVIVAFGLLNLPILGWLAAAAAPILIHLWSRRHYRQTDWAAMEFLLRAIKRQTRRILLEQWLVLAIRTAIIVLIVLAVAGAYWERPGIVPSASGGTAHRMLVIDASYSMDFKPGDKTRFEKAKELARRIVEDSRQGDALTLVLMSSPSTVVVGRAAFERSEILREIEALQPARRGGDLPGTLAVIEQLLSKVRRENPRITQHEIYFLTDLQRITWAPNLSGPALAEFRRRTAALAESAAIIVLDLGQAAAENLAVVSCSLTDPAAIAGRDATVQAAIKNFGRQARTHQPVELVIDGRPAQQEFADVPAGAEITVDFTHRFEGPGDHVVEVRAAGDALEVDNHRYLAVNVRQAVSVLCVDGRPSGERFRGAADYLAEALAPRGTASRMETINCEVAPESALSERPLTSYDCVFICDVAQFTFHEARLLWNYLQSGGSVVFFLGPRVSAESYNRPLVGEAFGVAVKGASADKQDRAGEGRILPAAPGEVVAHEQLRLDALGFRHPILGAFRGRGESSLLTTPVFKYFKLHVPKDSSARVALAMENGDPLVVQEHIGRGEVVLVATSADTSWTALPLWPSFPPLVHEMLSFCLSRAANRNNLEVGEPIIALAPSAAADAPAIVQTPDGQSQPTGRGTENGANVLEFADTHQSGVYTIRFGPPLDRNLLFAVNVNTAESDLAQLSPDRLQSDTWPGVTFIHQTAWQNAASPRAGASLGRAGLEVDLLYVVLLLLFLDTFLARRFGHHAT